MWWICEMTRRLGTTLNWSGLDGLEQNRYSVGRCGWEKVKGVIMDLVLFLVALVVDAADPFLWIAPIIVAFFSRRRPGLILLAALLWGGVLEFAVRPQLMSGYHYEDWFLHLASALLNGLVVLGVAALIWKMRKPRTEATAEQGQN